MGRSPLLNLYAFQRAYTVVLVAADTPEQARDLVLAHLDRDGRRPRARWLLVERTPLVFLGRVGGAGGVRVLASWRDSGVGLTTHLHPDAEQVG